MALNELAFGRIPAHCKYELYMERYRSGAEIIRNHKKLTGDTRFLDVGCGFGRMKYFFDDNEGQWFGIERAKNRIEVCRKLGYDVVDIDINKASFPYPDGHFDIIIASHVIEHLSNIDFCLKEMDRVLKKNGLILIATPTKPPIIALLIHMIRKAQEKKIGQTQNAFSAYSLTKFIGKRLPNYSLVDRRGFRIFSARDKLKLENNHIFYKISVFLGKHLMILVPEINLIFQKKS